MAADRPPGSNLGRSTTDWQQARLYYLSLPSGQRDYGRVAERFKVSVRTVERHGGDEHWCEQAAALDAEATAKAAAALVVKRAEQIGEELKLLEATFVSYAQQLTQGRVPIRPADLARLSKLRRQLWEDEDAEPRTVAATPPSRAAGEQSLEHKLEVLRALRDAGLLDRPEPPPSDSEPS